MDYRGNWADVDTEWEHSPDFWVGWGVVIGLPRYLDREQALDWAQQDRPRGPWDVLTAKGVGEALQWHWWLRGGRLVTSPLLGDIPGTTYKALRYGWHRHGGVSYAEILVTALFWTDTVLPDPVEGWEDQPPMSQSPGLYRHAMDVARYEVRQKINEWDVGLWRWFMSDYEAVDRHLVKKEKDERGRRSVQSGRRAPEPYRKSG